MTTIHNLGFPRIGAGRELKRALEAYWRGETDRDALLATGSELRRRHWRLQRDAGVDLVPVGDFSWYDHVLDTTALLGAVPERFGHAGGPVELDTYFRMARGRAPSGADVPACEMTKWFDTNYHYLVPELSAGQRFSLGSEALFRQVEEALAEGVTPKPVLVGPVTWLWLGKAREAGLDRLSLLEPVLEIYAEVLARLGGLGVEWVQLDEPILTTDLEAPWRDALTRAYDRLADAPVRRLLATYFGGLGDNLPLAAALPVDGLHVDLARAPGQLPEVVDALPDGRVLSAGVIDGRNVWRANPEGLLERLEPVAERLGERLWLAPSCSLLHVPVDAAQETRLDPELRSWLAFATQKLDELAVLRRGLAQGRAAVAAELDAARAALRARRTAATTRNDTVRSRLDALTPALAQRQSPYRRRAARQRERLNLPPLPTTTIGSFPQTAEIRRTRRDYRAGRLPRDKYLRRMQGHIAHAIHEQETVGLNVLVHGEPERNDMVEYFGEQLAGFAVTEQGWVQSYGSRCVKPPIIHGDVHRPHPITVEWIRYAQGLTEQPVKGMLTGPVTILQWSFVRDDQPREATCRQVALALRDEVTDLEAAGTLIIQIDEPAFREALPLRRDDHAAYLDWAVECFRLASCGVADTTQIHTHMCYSEFNDIIEAVAAMDADVITIETARSAMELLDSFERFRYPNEIGPGVYDIHSPLLPSVVEIETLLRAALAVIPAERLWVNPDCGLKTRSWEEVRPALANMVEAARRLRAEGAAMGRVNEVMEG